MLHTLPDEVLAKCLAILPHVEFLDIQRVCKSWVKLRRSKEFRVKCYKPGAEHDFGVILEFRKTNLSYMEHTYFVTGSALPALSALADCW